MSKKMLFELSDKEIAAIVALGITASKSGIFPVTHVACVRAALAFAAAGAERDPEGWVNAYRAAHKNRGKQADV